MISKYLDKRFITLFLIPFLIGSLSVLAFQPFNFTFVNFLDFITETERAMDTIAADPTLWAIRFENFRRFLLQRFPFEIWYEDHPEFIRILAIAHQRRRPFYWNRRVDGEFPGI